MGQVSGGAIGVAYTGTVTGLASIIGYTPDIFVPAMACVILDFYPGALGFQVFFTIIACVSLGELIAAYAAYRKIRIDQVLLHRNL